MSNRMEPLSLSPKASVAELLERWPQFVPIFLSRGMSCVGCSMSAFETLEDAARIYHVDLDAFLQDLDQSIQNNQASSLPSPEPQDSEAIIPSNTMPKELPMTTPYTFFPSLAGSIETIPTESIVSRTIYRDDHLKSIVFAFAPGQELSEHTASVPAIIQIIEGECELTLGTDKFEVQAGAWARMPANLPHSIVAKTPVKMLLLMLP